jgi:capsular exopolysaccharide synthesis family protein
MKKAQEKYTKLLQRRSALTHKEMPEESAKRLSLEGQLEFLKDSKQKLVASKISLEINKQLLNPPIEKVEAGKAIPLPQKGTKSIPFTILTALVIGIGSAYLLEYLNTSIRTEHDIRRYINLPLIGVMLKIKDPEQRLLINAAPKSPLSEAFNTTGTILETYATENNAKIFMIASSKAEEGKSTITTNLGVALARSGARVIIIDTDLRKAVLHRFFNIDNTKGLSSYVLARAEVSSYENLAPPPGSVSIDDIIKPTEIEGLSLIPAGPHPKNPVAILKSKVIKDLLSELKTRTDIILVDVPPVNIAVDTLVLAPIVDAIVLLISAGETNKDEVTFAKRMIESARGKLIGCMLNKVTIESRGYYYYYYYYYYYDRYKYYREE